MKTRVVKALLGAVVCSAASLACVAPASAAIVTGSWDPAFDAPLSALGWTARINVYVPDQCFQTAPAGFALNAGGRSWGCSSNPFSSTPLITVLSAELGIYDLATGSPDLLLDVITFSPASLPLVAVGIDTTADELTFYRAQGTSNTVRGHTPGQTDGYDFRIRLNDPSNPPFQTTTVPWVEFAVAGSGNFTRSMGRPTDVTYTVGSDANRATILAETRLQLPAQDVPEPTSVSLVLLALGAAGMAARRRSPVGTATAR